jgi:spermidine/putrescine transport system ATP-binding protein
VALVGADVWLSWAVDHGFGLADEPGETGRFPADDSTTSIAVQARDALVTELEEH